MKFCTTFSILLMLISGIAVRIETTNSSHRIHTTPKIHSNTSSSQKYITKVPSNIDLFANFSTIYHHLRQLNLQLNETVELSFKIQRDTVSIQFLPFSITYFDHSELIPSIVCQFHQYSSIQLPSHRFKISGKVIIEDTVNATLTNATYEIHFKNIIYTLVTRLQLNATDIDISYVSKFKIDKTGSNFEPLLTNALYILMEKIPSHLQKLIKLKLPISIFDLLQTTCIHPNFLTEYSSFETQTYLVSANTSEASNVQIQLSSINLEGLSFKNFSTFDKNQFECFIEDIEGEANWNYYSHRRPPDNFQSFRFSIDHVILRGTLHESSNDTFNSITVTPGLLSTYLNHTPIVSPNVTKILEQILIEASTKIINPWY